MKNGYLKIMSILLVVGSGNLVAVEARLLGEAAGRAEETFLTAEEKAQMGLKRENLLRSASEMMRTDIEEVGSQAIAGLDARINQNVPAVMRPYEDELARLQNLITKTEDPIAQTSYRILQEQYKELSKLAGKLYGAQQYAAVIFILRSLNRGVFNDLADQIEAELNREGGIRTIRAQQKIARNHIANVGNNKLENILALADTEYALLEQSYKSLYQNIAQDFPVYIQEVRTILARHYPDQYRAIMWTTIPNVKRLMMLRYYENYYTDRLVLAGDYEQALPIVFEPGKLSLSNVGKDINEKENLMMKIGHMRAGQRSTLQEASTAVALGAVTGLFAIGVVGGITLSELLMQADEKDRKRKYSGGPKKPVTKPKQRTIQSVPMRPIMRTISAEI